MARDWLSTLFLASFNGVPFWVKDDGAETGRRIHSAEFPGADDPFNEDMGRRKRTLEISGYCVGDTADAAMAAIEAACETAGAGALVMPAQGLLLARCLRIKRRREVERAGFFGFSAEFVREAFGGQAIPAAALANAAWSAAQSLGAVAPAFLNSAVNL